MHEQKEQTSHLKSLDTNTGIMNEFSILLFVMYVAGKSGINKHSRELN